VQQVNILIHKRISDFCRGGAWRESNWICRRIFPFSTELRVRITDVNYGGHMGNDSLLGLLHEARVQFLAHYGLSELDIGGLWGIIMADSVIVYKSEAFPGETTEHRGHGNRFQSIRL
jgi:acyl-CoA thioesterase FadM